MAVDQTRVAIEYIRELVKVHNFNLTGYTLLPESVIITLKKDIKTLSTMERTIVEQRIASLLSVNKWEITSSMTVADEFIITAYRKRTLTGII